MGVVGPRKAIAVQMEPPVMKTISSQVEGILPMTDKMYVQRFTHRKLISKGDTHYPSASQYILLEVLCCTNGFLIMGVASIQRIAFI